ncbi:MAG: oligoribonuclease [Gammaproteobacteria bacterium]|nr:MAG: oligoribonuclease [Gammaproteobacteria bacterium]
MNKDKNLVWIDLEMTGLDTFSDSIIEIATIVTNSELNVIAEGPIIAISTAPEKLEKMNKWNTEHHTKSGLVKRITQSHHTLDDAQKMTLQFLKKYVNKQASPMCGNSICQDRRFMARQMPKLLDYFHYRNLDVSTLKELSKRWQPQIQVGFYKQSKHQAMDDIKDSIAELRYYRQYMLAI